MKLKETADRMQNKERKRTAKKEREGEASLKSTSRKKGQNRTSALWFCCLF